MKSARETAECSEQGSMLGSTGYVATSASHVTVKVDMNSRATPYDDAQDRDFKLALLLSHYLLIFWTILISPSSLLPSPRQNTAGGHARNWFRTTLATAVSLGLFLSGKIL